MLQGLLDEITDRADRGEATNHDCMLLLNDNAILADKLTDCWIILDSLARGIHYSPEAIKATLRRQQVPGWKDNP